MNVNDKALLSGYSTKYNPQSCYYSEENFSMLSFEPVQFETTFYIKDKTGRVAISYTGMIDADMPLNYENLPAAIRSSYLEKETLTFKDRSGNVMTKTPLTEGADIYVTYTTDHLAEHPVTLSNSEIANYNLIVNGRYVYESDGAVKSGEEEEVDPNYLWNLLGEDPYAVHLRNVHESDKLLTFDANTGNLSFSDAGSNFILMSRDDGDYELMAATGGHVTDDVLPYYIGYTSEGGIKLYNEYAHDANEIRARLELYKPGATYRIIDRQNREILSAYIEESEILRLPDKMHSPLVKRYHYWKKDAFVLGDDETFTLKPGQTEISSVAEATVNKQTDIYVTYDVDETKLCTPEEMASGRRAMYRLVFSNDAQDASLYPYADEDCGIALWGEDRFKADAKRSAITRPSWGWYLVSDLKDPYHVQVASAAQYESWADGARLYLHTSGSEETTAGILTPGDTAPTDYMLLGADGAYRLAVGGEEDRFVTSFITASVGKTLVGNDGKFSIKELRLQSTLILLDRHGWEIMRKPLPVSNGQVDVTACDPKEIEAYNSPMVKAYRFHRGAQKVHGYHKFEVSDPIMVAGLPYTATSLTDLPTSYYSMGDNIYVTYDVKEEYENTYHGAETKAGVDAPRYLIYQGGRYAMADGSSSISAVPNETVRQIEAGNLEDIEEKMLWYVKPNFDIDAEMGYRYATPQEKTDADAAYHAAGRNGFDPYNLQIENVASRGYYFATNASGAAVSETAGMEATYSDEVGTVGLSDLSSTPVSGQGQGVDVELQMTNATFMAVQDANGNLRLMPRFDHARRLTDLARIAEPAEAAEPDDRQGAQTMLLKRLMRYTYIVVDNSGHEALRYRGSVGEEYPQMPALFRSPMAKDFKFYQKFERADEPAHAPRRSATASEADPEFYPGAYLLDDIAAKEVTGSFVAAGIYDDSAPIYVRYARKTADDYPAEGDAGERFQRLASGAWHYMKVGDFYIYRDDEGKFVVCDNQEPSADDPTEWWKVVHNASIEDLDPYHVTILNRGTSSSADGSSGEEDYVFLDHGEGALGMMVARKGTLAYSFLAVKDKVVDIVAIEDYAENGFSSFDDGSKVTFKDAPFHAPKYYIITNDGTLALIAKSSHESAFEAPSLPEWARSPLLNLEDYIYYADATVGEDGKYAIAESDRISNLCGLPQDIVYVRYNYNKETTPFLVDNTWLRGGETNVDIQQTQLDITGGTWYNIEYIFRTYDGSRNLWYPRAGNNNDMDYSNVSSKTREEISAIQSDKQYMFKLVGGDPYAIKIYNLYKGNDVLVSIDLNRTNRPLLFCQEDPDEYVQSFMMLEKHSSSDTRQFLAATGRPTILMNHRGINTFYDVIPSAESPELPLGDLLLDYLQKNTINPLTFYKAPSIGYYTFHGIRYKDDGTAPYSLDENGKPQVTWTAKLRRNWLTQVKLEEDIKRLYALYEKENTDNEFVPYDEAGIGRFYADQELQDEIWAKAARTQNVYPEIEDGEDFDIYFKYTVASEELATLTDTWETVAKDVAAYYADDATRGKLRLGKVNAKWRFMVLDTDEAISTGADGHTVGAQYFLYRRNDGQVGWLDVPQYTLHKDPALNINEWSYNRIAESYRVDDGPFREGRWLWTFVGDDPYNIHVLNMESAVGVIPDAEGIYSLPRGEECYAVATEATDENGQKSYLISIPTEKPTENCGWGLCPGYGMEQTFSLQLPMTDENCYPLYWRMATAPAKDDSDAATANSEVAKADSVAGMKRENDRSCAIQLLDYVPVVYEDVNLSIRRIDEVEDYRAEGYRREDLANMTTGISKLYFAESERMYAAGDKIPSDPEALPLSVRRAFCKYTLYSDDFRNNDGSYTVQAGPYPNYNEPMKDGYGNLLRDEDGKIIYHYYYTNPETGEPIPADGPQSIYASYEVTSDIFLKKAPTQEEVATMVNDNDHVYFMDFTATNVGPTAYDEGLHAYYEPNATFRDQTGDVLSKVDKENGVARTEKKVWDEASGKFVDDTKQIYNHYQFKTSDNRMTTAPERLKWYFVGDPYKVQVYCTAGEWASNNDPENPQIVGANLCRFDGTETNFQFVVDCVHLRVPDHSHIDERPTLSPTDEFGRVLGDIPNRGYKRPYYDDFYWEVVPAASADKEAFALRFKEDNDLLGYRNVYYYLSHDTLTKQYRSGREHVTYKINLSYNPDNERYDSGEYEGYHKANNANTVIKLTQPVKVYVSASRKEASGKTVQVTRDELSEYFGFGETLAAVPRHLQRKYVKYSPFTLSLTEESMPSSEGCQHADNVFVQETPLCNRTYTLNVSYELDDVTPKKKTGGTDQHLFTSEQDFEAGKIQWLDVAVNGNWFYYDKLGADHTKLSNYRSVVGGGDGWNDGLKGLHWAFVGDPYDFVIVNRRQYVDGTDVDRTNPYLVGTKRTVKTEDDRDSIIWTTSLKADSLMDPPEAAQYDHNHTSFATAAAEQNTHWSLQMWKTGDDADYFLRTASLKTNEGDFNSGYKPSDRRDMPTDINQTNNYWRMVAKQYKDGAGQTAVSSFFNLVPYSLTDRDKYSDDPTASNYSATMSGLGATQQRFEIHTVTDEDDDKGDNDCFDAVVSVVSEAGDVRIDHQKQLEVAYGDAGKKAGDLIPLTLRRYGCTYDDCFLLPEPCTYTEAEDHGSAADDAHRSIKIDSFNSTGTVSGDKTFRMIATQAEADRKPVDLTYVYKVSGDVSQFFTSEEDALTDEFVWLFAYFYWLQNYPGLSAVERTDSIFDHYIYNSAGVIIDEVYRVVKRTVYETNASNVPTSSYLDTHEQGDGVYSDESSPLDDERLKWGLVGDPYNFTMKNYAQYLNNPNSSTTVDENGNLVTSNLESTQLTIMVGADGKPYLAFIDEEGNVTLISFDFGSSSDKSLESVGGTGPNANDPTGNTMNPGNAKEFWLTGLTKYANLVRYHLVMAHQHSLEYVHPNGQHLSSAEPEANLSDVLSSGAYAEALEGKQLEDVDTRLHEFLKYWSKADGKDYLSGSGGDDVRTLLRERGTLRDFVSHPVPDAEVSRVGIGIRPSVPWYMKRQFCTYTMFQRDVKHSVPDKMIEADPEWIAAGNPTYKDENGNPFKADPDGNPMYTVKWVTIFDVSTWADWTEPKEGEEAEPYLVTEGDVHQWGNGLVAGTMKKYPDGFKRVEALQGAVISRLEDCHRNRMVEIDMIYDVAPDRFRFATSGRNSTTWYQMADNSDRLIQFTYRDGIALGADRTQHYTNDYLWAPQGDPYGFVLRSRYATVNGTGWDDVVLTTRGALPQGKDADGHLYIYNESGAPSPYSEPAELTATWTSTFDDKRIVAAADDNLAANAVYEMFPGSAAYADAFLMHPTAAWFDSEDPDSEHYMMAVHDAADGAAPTAALTLGTLTTQKGSATANWQLAASAEQLLPYFDRAGYVGGLDPTKALAFSNVNLRSQLRRSVEEGKQPAFTVLRQAQDVVYAGTFRDAAGKAVAADEALTEDRQPAAFESFNLVNMKPGYYRLQAFSEAALAREETVVPPAADAETAAAAAETAAAEATDAAVRGIVGPRYVSGYRFASEAQGTEPLALHFFETDMQNASIHTFGALRGNIDARNGALASGEQALPNHPSMQGHIELLPADFDPSSIFHFERLSATTEGTAAAAYPRYALRTQDLTVLAKPGTEGAAGKAWLGTKPADGAESDGAQTSFRVEDVGGAAMTLRIEGAPAPGDGTSWSDFLAKRLTTDYLAIDEAQRYQLLCNVGNEMRETAAGVQTTKWLLQPVGIKEDWPYNEMPLRVEVKQGGVSARNQQEADTCYYGTLYVPFDTRLGSTVDAAFTMTSAPNLSSDEGQNLVMPSVSQLNEMGNPQYVPASWPVVLRTAKPRSVVLKHADGSDYAERTYVDLFLPYAAPQVVSKAAIKLQGSYLERTLAADELGEGVTVSDDKTVMVFGVPFEGKHTHGSYNRAEYPFGLYTNDNWAREAAPGADAKTATDDQHQRDNKYVYHNKVYYVLDKKYEASGDKTRSIIVYFDGDELPDDEDGDDPYIADTDTMAPCDVYDLLGRRVARRETPATLRRNHPRLPKGVYLFGHRKVLVE